MSEVIIETGTDASIASELHQILCQAFEPFRNFYAQQAFADTLRTPEVFEERIISPEVDVLVAVSGSEIVGTVSTTLKNDNELYFFTMAVKPGYAGRGIGSRLLEKIESVARERK